MESLVNVLKMIYVMHKICMQQQNIVGSKCVKHITPFWPRLSPAAVGVKNWDEERGELGAINESSWEVCALLLMVRF